MKPGRLTFVSWCLLIIRHTDTVSSRNYYVFESISTPQRCRVFP